MLHNQRQNGLRHSFDRYYLSRFPDAAALALEMGNSPAMIFKHYRELVKPKDSAAYWNSRAYERTSLIVTTNLPFENWTEVLGSDRLTGIMLDRLTHRVHILKANGESDRSKDIKKRLKRP